MVRRYSITLLLTISTALSLAQPTVDLTLDEAEQRAVESSKLLSASRARLDKPSFAQAKLRPRNFLR